MCAVLQASGRLHARRSSFSICFSEASPSEHRRGGFLRGDQHGARCRKTPGAQMTAVLIVRGEDKLLIPWQRNTQPAEMQVEGESSVLFAE